MAFQAPRGLKDHLGDEALLFAQMAATASEVFGRFGYKLIATPMFEAADVFIRGLGEATDVVGKEMFEVYSPLGVAKLQSGAQLLADERFILRPEGTAGVARAVVEHGLMPPGAPVAKLWYHGPMFRSERPQKGRLRQFHQIGVECLGAADASIDAEVILMLMRFFEALGLPRDAMRLQLNSMGDEQCRPLYRDSIRDFINVNAEKLCDACQRRAQTNPLRAFDCKNPQCIEVMADAPGINDALCEDCRQHYAAVKAYLDEAQVSYAENPRLVRGLDYYTRTVFEVQVDAGLGTQNAIGGGGRYDGLIAEFGGKPTSGLGFAVGLERIALVLEALGVAAAAQARLDVFIACVEAQARPQAFMLCASLRDAGFKADMDHQSRSLKSQFKLADKIGAKWVAVLGPDELERGCCTLRNLATHEERPCALDALGEALALS